MLQWEGALECSTVKFYNSKNRPPSSGTRWNWALSYLPQEYCSQVDLHRTIAEPRLEYNCLKEEGTTVAVLKMIRKYYDGKKFGFQSGNMVE